MKNTYNTKRLELSLLETGDTDFIFELLNTEGWLKFIGDRHVRTHEDAQRYILKIMHNPVISYWVVKTIDERLPIGIISFIKRDYLTHHDIGFAFLPAFLHQGYAYEATGKVLNDLLLDPRYPTILATTLKDNFTSIRLLEKLGFQFDQEIRHEPETLSQYSIHANSLDY
jgi:[ribosomal protein S5]-alanine N-acetyltransferase